MKWIGNNTFKVTKNRGQVHRRMNLSSILSIFYLFSIYFIWHVSLRNLNSIIHSFITYLCFYVRLSFKWLLNFTWNFPIYFLMFSILLYKVGRILIRITTLYLISKCIFLLQLLQELVHRWWRFCTYYYNICNRSIV